MSDGVVVEASIVARLLGVKLLRLNADVTLLPARFEPAPTEAFRTETFVNVTWPGVGAVQHSSASGSLTDAVELLAHAAKTLRDTSVTT